MPAHVPDAGVRVHLSPSTRGAPDSLRTLVSSVLSQAQETDVASQQICERRVVDELAATGRGRRPAVRAFVEDDYLYEDSPVAAQEVWEPFGEREEHRQCLVAMLRAGIRVRTDHTSDGLQHVNMIIVRGPSPRALLTSANLAPQSLSRHFNWALELTEEATVSALARVFRQAWRSGFRSAELDHTQMSGEQEVLRVVVGGAGQAAALTAEAIDAATASLRFACFNIAKDAEVTGALVRAAARGVAVEGVVDGDQYGQGWDGVAVLRQAGVSVRYYPGARSGAIGRMHYKVFVVDGQDVVLTTANASTASGGSFEAAVRLYGPAGAQGPAQLVETEVSRLLRGAPVPG